VSRVCRVFLCLSVERGREESGYADAMLKLPSNSSRRLHKVRAMMLGMELLEGAITTVVGSY